MTSSERVSLNAFVILQPILLSLTVDFSKNGSPETFLRSSRLFGKFVYI